MSNEKLAMKYERVKSRGQVAGIGKFLTMLIVLCLLLIATACGNVVNPPIESGYGRISISFTEGEARTVLPLIDFDKYVYTFAKAGEESGVENTPDNEGFFTLEVGIYTVAVQAFMGDEDPYTLMASGISLPFSVGLGNNEPVVVSLSKVDTEEQDEQGEFSYTITFPAGAEAEITLQRWQDMVNVTLKPHNLIEENGITETLELEAGYYLLTVIINKDDLYAGINEAVHIYPSLSTVYIKDFDDNALLAATPIMSTEIIITAPVKNATPDTTVSGSAVNGGSNFIIDAVSWSPEHNLFLGSTVYTVTVRLKANNHYTFTGFTYATINGQNMMVSSNTGANITLSYTFPATDDRTVTGIAIKTQPTKQIFTHGDIFDLEGLVVTLTYDDNTTEDVDAVDFMNKNITASPSQGNQLVHETHDGQPFTIIYGDLTSLVTSNLIVNKAPSVWISHDPINNITYTATLQLFDLILPSGYEWNVPNTSLNAGDGQQFPATYTESVNHNPATGSITINVAKATGATVNTPVLNNRAINDITINDVEAPTNGQTVEYAINTENTAPIDGWQDNTTFYDLNEGTTYYIFARSKENINYKAGTEASIGITTLANVVITINFEKPTEDIGAITLQRDNNSLTFSIANAGGYSNFRWILDGITLSGATSGITLTASSLTEGPHRLTVIAAKGTAVYSQEIIFWINR